jgi:hypothetical protein
MEPNKPKGSKSQAGFTLIEAAVAILVLTIGVTAVAAVFATGLKFMGSSQDLFIARTKAQEAVESVFAGRDDQTLSWNQICNASVSCGGAAVGTGVFLDAALPINDPGPDGLVNTADDGGPEYIVLPGPDGVFGTADDIQVPLTKFNRQITIRDVPGVPNLRSLTVTVTYAASGAVIYKIQTFISPFA